MFDAHPTSIAGIMQKSLAYIHREPDADDFDDCVKQGAIGRIRHLLGFRTWGPIGERAQAVLDCVRDDLSCTQDWWYCESVSLPIDGTYLVAQDYGRRMVAAIVRQHILRSAA